MLTWLVHVAVGRVLPLVLLVALAVACVQVDIQSEFTEEGGASHSFRVAMSKEVLRSMGVPESDLQQQLDPTVTPPPGVTIEQFDTEDEIGFVMRTVVDDARDVGAQLNQLMAAGSEEDEAEAESFKGSMTRDGNRYSLDLTFDADAFFKQAGQAADEGIPPEMFIRMLRITYAVRLPGEVKEHNGALLEDGRIQWTLPYSGTLRMTARSEVPQAFAGILVVAVVGAVLVVAAGTGVALFARRRRKPAALTAEPGSAEGGPLPPGSLGPSSG